MKTRQKKKDFSLFFSLPFLVSMPFVENEWAIKLTAISTSLSGRLHSTSSLVSEPLSLRNTTGRPLIFPPSSSQNRTMIYNEPR